jgi:hypothetical protein
MTMAGKQILAACQRRRMKLRLMGTEGSLAAVKEYGHPKIKDLGLPGWEFYDGLIVLMMMMMMMM